MPFGKDILKEEVGFRVVPLPYIGYCPCHRNRRRRVQDQIEMNPTAVFPDGSCQPRLNQNRVDALLDDTGLLNPSGLKADNPYMWLFDDPALLRSQPFDRAHDHDPVPVLHKLPEQVGIQAVVPDGGDVYQ